MAKKRTAVDFAVVSWRNAALTEVGSSEVGRPLSGHSCHPSPSLCAGRLQNQNHPAHCAGTATLLRQKVPLRHPPSAYIIENDKDGIPVIWKQMVWFFWIFITIKKHFLPHQPRYSPGGRQGVKTFILMKVEGKGKYRLFVVFFSEAVEGNVERSVRPSIRLKSLSLTDCVNKGLENERGLSVYIARLPRCWYSISRSLLSFWR